MEAERAIVRLGRGVRAKMKSDSINAYADQRTPPPTNVAPCWLLLSLVTLQLHCSVSPSDQHHVEAGRVCCLSDLLLFRNNIGCSGTTFLIMISNTYYMTKPDQTLHMGGLYDPYGVQDVLYITHFHSDGHIW